MLNGKSEMVNEEISAVVGWQMAVQPKEVVLDKVRYRAVWRSHNLIILPIDCHPFRQSVSAVMEGNRDRLLDCLNHSIVRQLFLSSELPVTEVVFWAELGRDAGLPIYMQKCRGQLRTRKMSLIGRFASIFGAAALLLIVSPVMLFLSSVLLLFTGKVLERDWEIGERGRLFRAFKFVMIPKQLPIWLANLNRSRLKQWPILFNILRGDVGLLRTQSLDQLSSQLEQKLEDVIWDTKSAEF